ncbi:MAG TPA: hypothetical protein VFD70_12385 [Anaerolineae bacterium]|nr:hypothetical protein [Anaerolineae bacterium]
MRGGSVLDPKIAAQIKIENGKAVARRGEQDWQPIDDFSEGVAPGGDFLAFLSGAKNIVNAGTEIQGNNPNFVELAQIVIDTNGPRNVTAFLRTLALNSQKDAISIGFIKDRLEQCKPSYCKIDIAPTHP